MKRYAIIATTLLAGALSLTQGASARIPYRRLPAEARAFIERHFPAERCVYAERDRDDGRREYEVKLSNGTDIDFHGTGQWKKVDCGYSFLPEGIVPAAIVEDLAVRYPGAKICKVECERGGYEIKIGSGLELIYSADGAFVREDRF